MPLPRPCLSRPIPLALALLAAAALGACGGGGGGAPETAAAGDLPAATASTESHWRLDAATLPEAVAAQRVEPSFHVAPVLLDAPDDGDAAGLAASASRGPRLQAVPDGFGALPTRGLTAQALADAGGRARALAADGERRAQAAAGGSSVATYTPAQVRAAYGLPALPAAGSALTAAQAAQLGAGQTVYIVNAMHGPNVAAELAAFNQKFGLPACSTRTIAPTAALPLAAASTTAGCELAVVYSTAAGGMGTAAPAYDAGWATEIALDVQWAHATAPLARIVLIEAADATVNSLLGAIKLANAMGPGVVSMSFGGSEGSWTASVDAAFIAPKMSYLAATGDSGAAVSWPAVSANVVAVGGTSLSWNGAGTRAESGWSGTGGGTSAYVATPAYQRSAVPGLGTVARRTVADVAFNANPSTGQYVATIAPGASTPSWISAGGTSLSTPQWAGLIAVANALRAQAGKPPLGAPHAVLYGNIATVPGSYAGAFADIVQGSNGSCASCVAKTGYDWLTGLGTPNAGALLSALSGVSAPPAAPVVTAAAVSGQVGTALSFTVSVSAPNPVGFTLGGAPSGMTVSAAGVVTWATPVAGTYAVTVTAKDSVTGLSGQAVYTVTVAAPKAPTVTAATVSGRPGVALGYAVAVNAPNAVSWSLAGAPAGVAIGSTGVLGWANPVAGNYAVTVIAKDTKTGLSGQAVLTLQIAKAGPVITAAPMTGTVGKPMAGSITVSDPGAAWVQVSVAGAPLGMGFSIGPGLVLNAGWPSPVAGSYSLKVTVVDSAGLSATASVPVTIAAR